MDLSEFLLARIAEDEAVARAALAWQRADPADRWVADDGALLDGRGDCMAGYVGGEVAPHVARWDPARALAECDAKRGIVEWQETLDYSGQQRELLGLLALPYADHPDYDPAWNPLSADA